MVKADHEDCHKAVKPSEGSLHVSSVCLQKQHWFPLPPCSWRLTRESHSLDRAHRQTCLKSVNSQTDKGPFFPIMVLYISVCLLGPLSEGLWKGLRGPKQTEEEGLGSEAATPWASAL